jgi:tetratricopeptide (TPR) repeat protein
MIKWVGPLLLMLLGIQATAFGEGSFKDLFEEGNKAYQQKKYQEAISCYDSLLGMGYHSKELYYNVGNAYYKQGALPQAILFYERAKLLSGSWEPLTHNLSLARQQVTDSATRQNKPLLPRLWDKTLQYWPLQTWVYGTIAWAWLVGLGGIGRFLLRRRSIQRLCSTLALIAFLGFAISMGFTIERYQLITNNKSAIVTQPSVAVKSAPDAASKDRFVLQGGLKVRLTNQLNNWLQVQLPSGQQGWVHSKNLAIVRVS